MAFDSILFSSQFNLLSRLNNLSLLGGISTLGVSSTPTTGGNLSTALNASTFTFNLANEETTAALALSQASQALTDNTPEGVLNKKSIQVEGPAGETDDVTATAGPFAKAGEEYALDITQLAAAQTNQSNQVAGGGGSALAPGTHTIELTRQGDTTGQTYSVTVNAGDTNQTVLDNLAADINAREGYTAEVVEVGGGQIQLTITSEDTGEEAAYTISDLSGNLASTYGLDQTGQVSSGGPTGGVAIAAQNAQFSLNGVDQESATNTVSLDGGNLNLTLNDTTTEPLTLTVAADTEAVTGAVEDFVSAFNEQLDAFASNPSLVNQLSAQNLKNAAFLNETSLEEIGVSVDAGGRLSLDQDALEEALAESPDDVKTALSGTSGAATLAGAVASATLATPLVFDQGGTGQLFSSANSPATLFGLHSTSGLNTLFAGNLGFLLSFFA